MTGPLVVNTQDGTCWTRRGARRNGEDLYAPEGVCDCPPYVMATLAELAEHVIVGSADVLPVPAAMPVTAREIIRNVLLVHYASTPNPGLVVDTLLRNARAEEQAVPLTMYRAEHPDSGITLGQYGTPAAARAHCEAMERRSWPTGTHLAFDWIEDEEDGVAELVVTAGQNEESATGYMVTAVELPSEYDEGADE
ncbi:hypothetical protein [Streptomyces griseosporeus]|uniref:hypothetical protein n=1 Tax=Streptomyces griseosporeus TaxID=1910 RepID=UPI0036FABCA3